MSGTNYTTIVKKDQVLRLFRQGVPFTEIARRLHMSNTTVSNLVYKYSGLRPSEIRDKLDQVNCKPEECEFRKAVASAISNGNDLQLEHLNQATAAAHAQIARLHLLYLVPIADLTSAFIALRSMSVLAVIACTHWHYKLPFDNLLYAAQSALDTLHDC